MNTVNPIEVWNFFKLIFPNVAKEVINFKSHGRNSITLWFKDKEPIIFTIMQNKSWKLEPYKI